MFNNTAVVYYELYSFIMTRDIEYKIENGMQLSSK